MRDVMKKPNYYNQVLGILQSLHKLYPHYNMGRHLATALDGYGDTWGLTDKEVMFALSKYKSELDMDFHRNNDTDIEQIIEEGINLDNLFNDDDDGDNY
jgi:hypothetical protein